MKRSEYHPISTTPAWGSLRAPGWYLRLKLAWASQGIDRVQRELDHEFALTDTAPLYQELAELTSERDALRQKLAGRG